MNSATFANWTTPLDSGNWFPLTTSRTSRLIVGSLSRGTRCLDGWAESISIDQQACWRRRLDSTDIALIRPAGLNLPEGWEICNSFEWNRKCDPLSSTRVDGMVMGEFETIPACILQFDVGIYWHQIESPLSSRPATW